MGYKLEGKLLEACSCGGLCPCWVGDDPDTGSCYSMNVYHYDRGAINGIDVSGLTLAFVCIIPGNVLKGNWKVAAYVDAKATPEQKEAILAAHTGKLGGPLADLAQLVSDVVGVYDVPIAFDMKEGKGTIRVGDAAAAEMQPYTDAQGRPTKLVDTVFSTIPGSPAYVGKASSFKVNVPQHQMQWEYNGRNAILGDFRLEG
ncbi:MAG TPA: DUF1326 domain-containing protein [Chloroflexota bacterium]|nr:DUF1326 domain-containing protein [Chloroflexota bacterium]